MSRTSVVWLVAGLALLGLAIALEQRLTGGADEPTLQMEVQGASVFPSSGQGSMDRGTSAPGTTSPLAKLESAQTPRKGSVVAPTATAPSIHEVAAPSVHLQGSQQSGASEPVASAAGETGAMDPAAVVGRHFPVSASVIAGCKSRGGCPNLDEQLDKFAQEPRDLAWAADVESKLRALVMASSGQFAIRSVECRTSLCAIEVASLSGPFLSGISLNPALRALLYSGYGAFGIERDASSAKIVVTLLTLERQ